MLDDTDPMIRRFTNTFWTLAALAFLIPVALFFLVVWGDMLWELFFR